jgi:dTDP-4-dehydrorhamnose reductase
MKIIVTGANGLLGRDVWRSFEVHHELLAIGRTRPDYVTAAQWRECDLTDARQTYACVTRENPDWVIHCAAYNQVDLAETRADEAYQGNALATRNLALACQRFDTVLMAVSSDYVFDGQNPPKGGYREFDPCRPLSRYGESKRWAELFTEQLLNKFFVVRTSWLFGPGRSTWVDQVALNAAEGKPVQAIRDMVSSPTYTPDLAKAMLALAESQVFGFYHLSNSGFCTRVELAEEILRLNRRSGYGLFKTVTQDELRLPARRPVFSGLENLAWRINGFPPLRSWKEALQDHFSHSKVPS